MTRLYPETEFEKTMLAMGAIFIEENHILENVYAGLGLDPESEEEILAADEEVRNELTETFFRLDMNLDPYLRADCLGFLEELWSVFDVISAKRAIDELRMQGHRTKFNVLKTHTNNLHQFKEIFKFDFSDPEEVQMGDEEFKVLAAWVAKADSYVPKVGILAWDAARYVHLVRLCFVANYLRADEAWKALEDFAPLVRNKFSTWNEFSQSFLIGRTFWAGAEDPELKGACERLVGLKASPWLMCSLKD